MNTNGGGERGGEAIRRATVNTFGLHHHGREGGGACEYKWAGLGGGFRRFIVQRLTPSVTSPRPSVPRFDRLTSHV